MDTIFKHLMSEAQKYALQHNIEVIDFGVTSSMVYVIVDGRENKQRIGVTLVPYGEGEFGSLKGRTVKEIFSYALNFHPLQRAFALALINALGQYAINDSFELKEDIRALLSKNILDMTQESDEILFIGNLKPVVNKLRENKRVPIVFCRNREHYKDGVYSDIFEYEMIQKNSVAIITGATLIGSTIDALIKLSPKESVRILAGFSAGAHPSWFKGTGITHIASISLEVDFKEYLYKNQWEKVFEYPSYFVKV